MTKVAILIDGGYLLKRLPAIKPDTDHHDAKAVSDAIGRLVQTHLYKVNKIARADDSRSLLYRVFYYDAKPYPKKGHLPISKKAINYAVSEEARFRLALFDHLRSSPSTAVRLG